MNVHLIGGRDEIFAVSEVYKTTQGNILRSSTRSMS